MIDDESTEPIPPSQQPIAWQSAEGNHPSRGAWWYLVFGLVLTALVAIGVLLLKSWTFVILLVVMASAVVVFAMRPLQEVNYAVSPKGVYVGDQLYGYDEFRSFGLINEGAVFSVILLPTKRFSPSVSIYFSEELGEPILDMLGSRLPMEEIKPDRLERFIRLIRL